MFAQELLGACGSAGVHLDPGTRGEVSGPTTAVGDGEEAEGTLSSSSEGRRGEFPPQQCSEQEERTF